MDSRNLSYTAKQQEELATLGFTIISDFFDASEIDSLDRSLTEFHVRSEAKLRSEGGTAGISRVGEILFSPHIAEQSSAVRAFVSNEKMTAVASGLLGPNVDLYWDQTVYKNPEAAREFPWHQDDAYTPVTPSPYLTCWLAITDATVENGCISVLPGSHANGLVPHQQTELGLVGYSNSNPDQGIFVPVRRGSLIVFWSTVLHKSGPNVSHGIRKAYIMQYAARGLRFAKTGELVPDLIPICGD